MLRMGVCAGNVWPGRDGGESENIFCSATAAPVSWTEAGTTGVNSGGDCTVSIELAFNRVGSISECDFLRF